MPGASGRRLERRTSLDAHVDPELRPRRAFLVGPCRPSILPRYLEGRAARLRNAVTVTAVQPGSVREPHVSEPGAAAPLGASVSDSGVNFSVFSKHASHVELLLFDAPDATAPAEIVALTSERNRSYYYWHTFVPGLRHDQVYAFRSGGPWAPERGLRFDAAKTLLDPYGLAVAMPAVYDREAAARPGDNAAVAMKSVVVDPSRYDWQGDRPLRR